MKTLCIDARFWGVRHTGVGRYVENLIDNLPSEPAVKVVLIVPPDLKYEPKLARFEKLYARFHPYSLFAQSEMFFLLWRLRPDLTHFTQFSIPVFWFGKFVVTIHDLIKHYSTGPATTTRNPVWHFIKRVGYQLSMFVAVHRSARIIVPAYYWKSIIARTYMVSPEKIEVTYEGSSPVFSTSRKYSPHTKISSPYVIYTGNLYPHKNIPVLISAIDLINSQNPATKPLRLAIICARSVFQDRLPPSPYVKYLGYVSDEELIALYQHASAFVFPSLIEGFGLPGLESMSCGCPVIAAAASCLPEVYGSAALYFQPTSPIDLADKISMLLNNNQLRNELVAAGLAQAKKYSWSKMSKQTWQIYQNELRSSTTG